MLFVAPKASAQFAFTTNSGTITITGGEMRSDLPDWGLELPRGSMSLAISYTARYRGDFAGGFAFTGANLGLRLPDGTTLGARADGHSQSVAVLEWRWGGRRQPFSWRA